LNNFDNIIESDLKNLSHLSKRQAFDKLTKLLEMKKKIICDLYDRDGKINDQIISLHNNFELDQFIISLKHGDTTKLSDKFLYNINYNLKKDEYYLTIQDEYFEKINIEK